MATWLVTIAQLPTEDPAARMRVLRTLLFAAQSQASLGTGESFLRRTWVTRRPPWADRLACAWLVRRFVDPEATLVWLDKAEEMPAGALGFAFDGAHFAAKAGRVAY